MRLRITLSIVALIGIGLAVYYSTQSGLNFSGLQALTGDLSLLISVTACAIILQFAGHWVRANKQKIFLEQIRSVKTPSIFRGQIVGSLFNLILPFRIGELVRAHYVARGVSISRSAVFATILFERLIDSIFLILVGIIVFIAVSPSNDSLISILYILTGLSALLAFLLYSARSQKTWLLKFIYHFSGVFNPTIRNQIRMMSWSAIYMLKHTITLKAMPRYLGQTLIMWLLYFVSVFVFVTLILGQLAFPEQILSSLSAYLGVSIPSGPSYLGTFQSIFSSASLIPTTFLRENSITLLLWLLFVAPVAVMGAIFLLTPEKSKQKERSSDLIKALRNKLYRDINITEEFALFLDAYFQGDKINRILTTEEVLSNFQVIKSFKGGSKALTLLVWHNERMVVKKITLKQYQEKLSSQYEWLNERSKLPEIAKVLDEYKDHPDYYAIDIEYRDEFIPFFDFIHSSSAKVNTQILKNVFDFVNTSVYKPVKKLGNGKRILDDYIETKIIGKVTDASSQNLPISNILAYQKIIVNGQTLDNFDSIIKRILKNTQAMKDLSVIFESPIHGDLTIDNIIVNPKNKSFIVLDPNNENAISDPVVDYGKLMQSLHSGYEFLCSLPTCYISENKINFEESRSLQYDKLHRELVSLLESSLSASRYKTVLFHEAVHYCRMLTYRCDINPSTAAVFYGIAVRLLNEYLKQYEPEKKAVKGDI